MDENNIANSIIGASIEVHKRLGPGLLETAYQACLQRELDLAGLRFEAQAPVAIEYKGETIGDAYRLDLIVEDRLIVELKAVEQLTDKHLAQLLTYLRLTNKKLGLLINFNERWLKQGIKRVVNNL